MRIVPLFKNNAPTIVRMHVSTRASIAYDPLFSLLIFLPVTFFSPYIPDDRGEGRIRGVVAAAFIPGSLLQQYSNTLKQNKHKHYVSSSLTGLLTSYIPICSR